MFGGAVGFLTAFLTVLLLERLVKPGPGNRAIFHGMSLLAAMPLVLFYLSLFMATYRPVFATLFTIIVFLGIVVVNNAKFRVLQEPLVYSDFALLRQAIAHPRLYVGYIGPIKVAAVIAVGGTTIVGCLLYEPPVIDRDRPEEWIASLAYFAIFLGAIYLVVRGPLRNELRAILKSFGATTDVRDDVDKLSLVTSLIFYFFLAGESEEAGSHSRDIEVEDRARKIEKGAQHPPIVAVQNESFFNARRILKTTPPGFLTNFERMRQEALFEGRLRVPAWGANTLRTEFAFLSGIPSDALGVDRFNPYLSYCNKPVWTIASYLKSIGYRTICVHPFHKSFFRRAKVYPNLGFDEFVDIASFSDSDRVGPYVSDAAVATKVEELLDTRTEPVFIFVITMENHGPWSKDRVDVDPAIQAAAPRKSKALLQYLEHLQHADEMIGRIADALRTKHDDSIFCFYGDHIPSMPKIFNAIGYNDPRTDYFIWRNGDASPSKSVQVSADALGRLVLEAMVPAEVVPKDEAGLRRLAAGEGSS
ncbi:MAG: LTA synthase family protein [Parvibaculum sp.]